MHSDQRHSPIFTKVENDPIDVQMYTLSNGLKLFLSINKIEPRVYTEIAVRAGSKHDPADTTGLAHYFEHMMFKGTDRLGSLNWKTEKPILDKIEQLFEQHRKEQNPEKKKKLYAEIDKLSFEAAKLVSANEYDRLVSAMGAKNTNAYTWVEQTVYVDDVPSNELERWFILESERFRRPILRLFHTELETVYEEYNISQDRDFRKTMRVAQETLTPTHPYGTQTTLGRGEDLKNPSQTNIYNFFDQYYVPNNIAITLCGDFEPNQAVLLAEKYFGHFKSKPIPEFKFPEQPSLKERVQRDVYGQEANWVDLSWRFDGASSDDALMLVLLSGILYNQQAGLIDLNLIQKQQLLESYAYPRVLEDFSSLVLHGKPRDGQSLADVEKMLLDQVDKLCSGDFEDWLPGAVVMDMKATEMRQFEKNNGRASALTNAYILGLSWEKMVKRWEILEKITAADIQAFAQKHLHKNNYVAVYKHQGEDTSVEKVEKPPITPVELNRNDLSDFGKEFLAMKTPDIEPEFINFYEKIGKAKLGKGTNLYVIHEEEAPLFRLFYVYDMGKSSNRKLSLAASYLSFLGTSEHTGTEVQQLFYRYGLQMKASCKENRFYITLSGLKESYERGLELMEKLLADPKPNSDARVNLVSDIIKRRQNAKTDKRTILAKAMMSYGKYGINSPFRDRLSIEELKEVTPEELTDLIKSLRTYEHEVFYYGPLTVRKAARQVRKFHHVEEAPKAPLPKTKYKHLTMRRDQVLFVDFPTVQVELLLLSKGTPKFTMEEHIFSEWYNNYFGYGLSSIVFQEIRESKALAYSAYAYAASPLRKKDPHYLKAYVGTQPDKLDQAVEAFQEILENMPISLQQMETARESVLRQLAAGRISKEQIYWAWRQHKDRGIRGDLREQMYQGLQHATPQDLIDFHAKHVKGRHYTWLVLGDKKNIDFKFLRKIGPVHELTLEQVFGY